MSASNPFPFAEEHGNPRNEPIRKVHRMKRFRIINGLVGALAFLATEAGREWYRPYIYANRLRDFGIADTLGNSLGTVAAVFIILTVSGKNNSGDYRLIWFLTAGLCAYELLQGPMGGSIDPNDMIATVIAGMFCKILYRFMHHHPFRLWDNKEEAA